MYNCYCNRPNYYMMDNDEDLEMMYPSIYRRVRPMIIMHCNLLEKKHGHMCKPSHKELDEICEDIYDKIKDRLEDVDDEDDDDHHYRQRRRFGRRRALNDLFRILLLQELVGRRRRRRRRPHYGYW